MASDGARARRQIPSLVISIFDEGRRARVIALDPATGKQEDRSAEFHVKQLVAEAPDGVFAGYFVCSRVEGAEAIEPGGEGAPDAAPVRP